MYRNPFDAFAPLCQPGAAPSQRAAERHSVDVLVRYAWNGRRGTVMLKDLTRFGGRIEVIAAIRQGDWLTLLMPGLPATLATVAWARGGAAGLSFDEPLGTSGYNALIADFSVPSAPLPPRQFARAA